MTNESLVSIHYVPELDFQLQKALGHVTTESCCICATFTAFIIHSLVSQLCTTHATSAQHLYGRASGLHPVWQNAVHRNRQFKIDIGFQLSFLVT
jgi:hypothetical protein